MLSVIKSHKIPIFFIFVAYILLFLWHRHMTFMDEVDNIMGALSISQGHDIYSGYISQHTPFVYYLFSIFAFFGVQNYETFRLVHSLLLLSIWFFIYFRYHRDFGKTSLIVTFIIYPITAGMHWGHMILSDVYQGFALFVLLLELLVYWKEKKLSYKNAFVISMCIFVAVMSAFISVYLVFIIFLGFFIHEFMHNRSLKDYLEKSKDYAVLVGLCIIPFALSFSWYAASGNLENFYFQAYTFNREYYSKYLNGFGSDGLSVFRDTLVLWIQHITSSLTKFNSDSIFTSLIVVFVLLFIMDMFKKSKVLGFIVLLFFAFTGTRGYMDFHAITYYILGFFALGNIIQKSLLDENKYTKGVIHFLAFLIFLIPLNSYIPYAGENILSPIGKMDADPYDTYIQALTKPDDKIWISSPPPNAYIKNHREPATRMFNVLPWFADAYSDEIINDLKKNKPKLITFVPEQEVWGKKYSDFASEIYEYIQRNYQVLGNDNIVEKHIYIRNDYFVNAQEKMKR